MTNPNLKIQTDNLAETFCSECLFPEFRLVRRLCAERPFERELKLFLLSHIG